MNRRTATVLVDALFLVLLVLILLPHSPPGEDDPDLLDRLVIEARWPDGFPADVDLWVRGPGDPGAVGYSRRQGPLLSLVRDDLGKGPGEERRELALAREIPDGDWIVNLHLFRNDQAPEPVPVTVTLWQRRDDGFAVLWRGSVVLESTGQEITAVRWSTADGVLLPGSIHDTTIAIRGVR